MKQLQIEVLVLVLYILSVQLHTHVLICVSESWCDHKLSKKSVCRRMTMPTVGEECNLMNISKIMNTNEVFNSCTCALCLHILYLGPLLQSIFLLPCPSKLIAACNVCASIQYTEPVSGCDLHDYMCHAHAIFAWEAKKVSEWACEIAHKKLKTSRNDVH